MTARPAHTHCGPGGVHFGVAARELLLDEPQRCPVYPPLAFVGIAVDAADGHHLMVTTPAVSMYLGTTTATVTRRAEILAAALAAGGACPHSEVLMWWVMQAWESLLDERVELLAHGLDAW